VFEAIYLDGEKTETLDARKPSDLVLMRNYRRGCSALRRAALGHVGAIHAERVQNRGWPSWL
jgi:hypothetical protein